MIYCKEQNIKCKYCFQISMYNMLTNEMENYTLCDRQIHNKKCINLNKINYMKDYVKRMIEEHAQLVSRIVKLHEFIYDVQGRPRTDIPVNFVDYANMCIQLKAMRVYRDALEARLENNGIKFDGRNYSEFITTVGDIIHPKDEELPVCKANSNNDPTDEE